ncbi:MAG: SAM-dependent methyltransferase [Acidobacteria bacterium]|nr:SAM-dependent methyltransferase [Acidobacteriota bacterium]
MDECGALRSRLRYVFDETSADARSRAAELLSPFARHIEFRNLDEFDAPFEAGVIFSNELLDALPVHRVVMRDGKLLELYVSLNVDGAFVWVEREPSTTRLAEHFERARVTLAKGQIAEINLEAEAWIERSARTLRRGYVITVDYGDEDEGLYGAPHRREGTLRAFRGHAFAADVLDKPGQQDLTTTVNWTQIKRAGERAGLETLSLERQDAFLLRAGLLEQLEVESAMARSESEVVRLRLDAREMILPGGMSEHFQVLVQKRVV